MRRHYRYTFKRSKRMLPLSLQAPVSVPDNTRAYAHMPEFHIPASRIHCDHANGNDQPYVENEMVPSPVSPVGSPRNGTTSKSIRLCTRYGRITPQPKKISTALKILSTRS